MSCEICEMIESKKGLLYEDERAAVLLAPNPATLGHVLVVPKEHHPILEQVPDFVAGHLFNVANKVSSAIFESLNIQGTNVIIENGVAAGQSLPHVSLNVVPRLQNDNMNLSWQPKQLSEEEMSTVELKVKDFTKVIGDFEREKPKPIELDRAPNMISEEKENYLLKQLRRIP